MDSFESDVQEFVDNAALEVNGVAIPVLVRRPPNSPDSSHQIDCTREQTDGDGPQFSALAVAPSKSPSAFASSRVSPEASQIELDAVGRAAVADTGRSTPHSAARSRPASAKEAPIASDLISSDAGRVSADGIGIVKQFAFSSQLQRSSVLAVRVHHSAAVGAATLYAKGAPEMIATLCCPASRVPPISLVFNKFSDEKLLHDK